MSEDLTKKDSPGEGVVPAPAPDSVPKIAPETVAPIQEECSVAANRVFLTTFAERVKSAVGDWHEQLSNVDFFEKQFENSVSPDFLRFKKILFSQGFEKAFVSVEELEEAVTPEEFAPIFSDLQNALAALRGFGEILLKRANVFLTSPAIGLLEEIYREIGSVEEKSGLTFEASKAWEKVASSKKTKDV